MKLKSKIIIITLFIGFLFFASIEISLAVQFTPQISIPGSDFKAGKSITIGRDTTQLAKYIKALYTYAISIVGIVATIMLMFGGLTWLTAGGSGEKVGRAKDIIFSSLTGLTLALTSYMILTIVNPDLVNFNISKITETANPPKNADQSNDLDLLKDGGTCSSNGGTPTGVQGNDIPGAKNSCAYGCITRNLVISFEKSYLYNENDAYCCVCIDKP